MGFDYFHLLDADVWKEIENRKILSNGYVYIARKMRNGYDVKVFVKKKE